MNDQLDVNEVMAEMRAIIGEQAQQIAMLRAAHKKDTRPADEPGPPPVPED